MSERGVQKFSLYSVEIIDFWFSNEKNWFVNDDSFDELIRNRFLSFLDKIGADELESLKNGVDSCLAGILLFDQFTRNMFRGNAKMYSYDDKALSLTLHAIQHSYDKKLPTKQHCQFLYMPLMHSESLDDQKKCVELFESLDMPYPLDYARDHMMVVEKFGRFPHRNKILGRESTSEEIEFMKTHSGY